MSVTLHPTGQYRAYKKIGGREFQYYSKSYQVAAKHQAQFEQYANLYTPSPFREDGSIIGVSLKKEQRAGRKSTVSFRIKIKAVRRDILIKSTFDEAWLRALAFWSEALALTPQDNASWQPEIKKAKVFYLRRLASFGEF